MAEEEFWKTVDLKKLEIPEEVIAKETSITVNEGNQVVDTVRVFFREAKPSDGNKSITLLLLHGQAFSSKTWLDLKTISMVAAMGYRVIAIDLPGYGKSHSALIHDRGEFLRQLIDAFGIEKPVIVSPSMSGFYVLPFLIKYWYKLTGYIPVAPVGIEVLEKLPKLNDTKVIEQVYEPLRSLLSNPIPDLSSIKTPTMIVFGEKDRSRSSALLSLLPLSQCQEIPNGRHPAYLDDPDLWHKLLYNFLDVLSTKE